MPLLRDFNLFWYFIDFLPTWIIVHVQQAN